MNSDDEGWMDGVINGGWTVEFDPSTVELVGWDNSVDVDGWIYICGVNWEYELAFICSL